MPNQPKTTARTIRVDDDRWEAFKRAAAEREGMAASAVLNRYIDRYIRPRPNR